MRRKKCVTKCKKTNILFGLAILGLFFYEPLNETFGELSAEAKNKISHRGEALKKVKDIIVKLV